MEKLMDNKSQMSKKEPRYYEDDDTVKVACCGSFTYRCSASFIGFILILEFFVLCFELYFVATNDYFALGYQVFYAFLLIFVGVAALAFLIWLCNKDDPSFKSNLPYALLLAIIANVILFFMIIIYITAIYDNKSETVIVQKSIGTSEKQDEADGEGGQSHHNKELKD